MVSLVHNELNATRLNTGTLLFFEVSKFEINGCVEERFEFIKQMVTDDMM